MGDIPEVSDGGQSRLSHLICAGKRGRGSRNGPYAIFVALERRRGLLLNLLIDTIEADRYPMSPRIRLLRAILDKFGEMGPLPPDLAQKLRRYAPSPPARRPTLEERDPNRAPRQGRRPRR